MNTQLEIVNQLAQQAESNAWTVSNLLQTGFTATHGWKRIEVLVREDGTLIAERTVPDTTSMPEQVAEWLAAR